MHSQHGDSPAPTAPGIDPVCGMTVDPATAKFSALHDGVTYHFCSQGCQHKFNAEPGKYLAPAGATVPLTGTASGERPARGAVVIGAVVAPVTRTMWFKCLAKSTDSLVADSTYSFLPTVGPPGAGVVRALPSGTSGAGAVRSVSTYCMACLGSRASAAVVDGAA